MKTRERSSRVRCATPKVMVIFGGSGAVVGVRRARPWPKSAPAERGTLNPGSAQGTQNRQSAMSMPPGSLELLCVKGRERVAFSIGGVPCWQLKDGQGRCRALRTDGTAPRMNLSLIPADGRADTESERIGLVLRGARRLVLWGPVAGQRPGERALKHLPKKATCSHVAPAGTREQ